MSIFSVGALNKLEDLLLSLNIVCFFLYFGVYSNSNLYKWVCYFIFAKMDQVVREEDDIEGEVVILKTNFFILFFFVKG